MTQQGKKPWDRNRQRNVQYQAEAKIVEERYNYNSKLDTGI
jgi:hypothetical protein